MPAPARPRSRCRPTSSPIRRRSSNSRRRSSSSSGALGRLLAVSEHYPDLKVEPELPRAAVAARGHREPHRGGAARLHRGGAAYNTELRTFPGRDLGLDALPEQQADGDLHRRRGRSPSRRRSSSDLQRGHVQRRSERGRVDSFSACSVLLPPPLRGEGWGEGGTRSPMTASRPYPLSSRRPARPRDLTSDPGKPGEVEQADMPTSWR